MSSSVVWHHRLLKMNFTRPSVLGSVWLLIFIGCLHSNKQSLPLLDISPRNINLGVIDENIIQSFVVNISNKGGKVLKIRSVKPSCGCTATMIDSYSISPGDSTRLKISFDPSGKAEGEIKKTITVYSNSAEDTAVQIVFKATIKRGVHATTASMKMNNIFEGECANCHYLRGKGFKGAMLYVNDCAICHASLLLNAAPRLEQLRSSNISEDSLDEIISMGRPEKNMPGFNSNVHGPLTDNDIRSLVDYIKENIQ